MTGGSGDAGRGAGGDVKGEGKGGGKDDAKRRPRIRLETARLVVTDLGIEDAPALFAYRSEPSTARFQSFRPLGVADAERFIGENTRDLGVEGAWFQLGVFAGGLLVGDMGMHFLRATPPAAEIGYTIAAEHRGKGYGKEAVGAVLGLLFGALGMTAVYAAIDAGNAASRALATGVGLRPLPPGSDFPGADATPPGTVVYGIYAGGRLPVGEDGPAPAKARPEGRRGT